MKAQFSNVKISAISGVVPENISYFDDEIENYSHSRENSLKLKATMGYNQHRLVKGDATTSDLAVHAVQKLFDDGLVTADEIDALIFVSQTPDHHLPPTSTILHGRLGLDKDCYCIDINDGCAGYIRGYYEAASFLNNTESKKVLLITGDVLSKKVSNKDRNSFPLIGDACCASIIEKCDDNVSIVTLQHDGTGWEALKVPAGGARLACTPETAALSEDEDGNLRALDNLVMKGRDVFTFTQTTVMRFITNYIKKADLTPQDFDFFFFHQANSFILSRFRSKLKVSEEQLPETVVREHGNSSSATVPMSIICHWDNHVKNAKNRKSLLGGFGVGLSWGCIDIDLKDLTYCNLTKVDV